MTPLFRIVLLGHLGSTAPQSFAGDGTVVFYLDMKKLRVTAASVTVAHMLGTGLGDFFFEKGLQMLPWQLS